MSSKTGKFLALALACALAVFFLYLFRLDAIGLVSTDEPRYAAIGRAMARSGDWVTPKLWGTPWFEKPALLYWMTGLATLAGLGPELAPRLPVALLSIAFLCFYFTVLRKEWNTRAAFYAVAILATSGGWLAYSQIAVFDLPLAVFFNAALLLTLPWLRSNKTNMLPWAAAMLGLAVLAKGLVPLVLVIPFFWFAKRNWRHLLHPAILAAFLAVSLPWYVLCTLRNGDPFLRTFFLQHQIGRFTSPDLQHSQSFWFYLPVLLAFLFPWTACIGLLFRPSLFRETHTRLFAAIVVWGLVFFSLSTNKLPGYLLPLLPAIAALIGLSLDRIRFAAPWLAFTTVSLVWIPVIIAILPVALTVGIRKAWPVDQVVKFQAAILLFPLLMLGAVELLADRYRFRHWAVAAISAIMTISVVWVKLTVFPSIDRTVSPRSMFQSVKPGAFVCAANMPRAWRYGLNYYFDSAIPDCKSAPERLDRVRVPVVLSH